MKTKATEMFGLDVPIFAFSHCRDVVVEATRAGGMGVLGTTRIDPVELEAELKWIDRHTDGRPYALDLALPAKMERAVPMSERERTLPPEHVRFVDKLLEDAAIPPLPDDERKRLYEQTMGYRLTAEGGMELIEVALEHPQVRLVVGALGVPPPEMIEVLHRHDIKVGALAGNVEHARKSIAAGVDIIVAQGMEAGAHTGNIASMVLWPQMVDAVAPVPVLAAGGVGRGRQFAAALALGAEGVWCGSIWLGTRESELSPEMKERFFAARSEDAVQRKVFTGKQCRMLRSRFTEAWEAPDAPRPLPMPLQSMLVAEARARIERAKAKEYMGYYVGQIVGDMTEETSTRGVIHDMLLEFAESAEKLARQLNDDE
ncbi:MAG TPA: nitronate monooxygenase [Burkholderiaceae bacterium]|nr:nitronate monooxygenase [Burkholderiaceae bacterium]